MLQHVFAQQAKFLANSLNTNKVEHSDNGSTLIIKQRDQPVKYSAWFFKRISDHIAKDTVPSSLPRLTPAHALPSNQVIAITTSITMVTIGQDNLKKSPKPLPWELLPMTGTTRRLAVSSQLAVLIKLSLVFSMQRRESSLRIYSQTALSLLLVLSSISRIRVALSLAPCALVPILWNGILSSWMTKQRSWSISVTPEMDGWMANLSRSTRPKSRRTTLSSLAMIVVQRPRVCKAFANCGVSFFIIKCCAKHE